MAVLVPISHSRSDIDIDPIATRIRQLTKPGAFQAFVNSASIFERFKIHKMRVTIQPPQDQTTSATTGQQIATSQNPYIMGPGQSGSIPTLGNGVLMCASYIDRDDLGNTSPNPTQVLCHTDAWPKRWIRPHVRSFVPGISLQAEDVGVVGNSGVTRYTNKEWLSCNTAQNMQLNGLKFCAWLEAGGAASQALLRCHCTIDIKVEFQGISFAGQPDIVKLKALLANMEGQQGKCKDDTDGTWTDDDEDEEEEEDPYAGMCDDNGQLVLA